MLNHNPDKRRGRQLLQQHIHAANLVLAGLIAVGVGISNLSFGLALNGLQSTMVGLHEAGRCALGAAQSETGSVVEAESPSLAGNQALSA